MNRVSRDQEYSNLFIAEKGDVIVKKTVKAKELVTCSLALAEHCLEFANIEGVTLDNAVIASADVDSLVDDFVSFGCSDRNHAVSVGGDLPDDTFDDNVGFVGFRSDRYFIRIGRIVTILFKFLQIQPLDTTQVSRVYAGGLPFRSTPFTNPREASGTGTFVILQSLGSPLATPAFGYFGRAEAVNRANGPGIDMYFIHDSHLSQDPIFGPAGGTVIVQYEADGPSLIDPPDFPLVSCNN